MGNSHRWPRLASSTSGEMLGGGKERGTGTPPLGSMAESGLTPRRNPPHPSTSTIQRSITCPARPFSGPSQCPFWSLALTELHPIYHDNSPPPSLARVGVEFLHYCSSPPFSSSPVKVSPTPLVGLAISFPAALCKTEQFWSFLAALCNRGWQSQWAQSQTCPVVSIRPTALDLPPLFDRLGVQRDPCGGW